MGSRWGACALALLTAMTALVAPAGSVHSGDRPSPAEFPDLTDRSGADFWVHKWVPGAGEPASLLDVLPAGSPAAGDFNLDGFPDVFVPSPQYTNETLNALREPRGRLFMNDGSGAFGPRFHDVTDVAGLDLRGWAYASSWADYDGDGFPDLFVGGYRLARLFHNGGDGTFTEATAQAGLSQEGLVLGGAWGDYDRDGFLDLLLVQFADYTHPDDGLPDFHDLPGKANVLLRNRGDGSFEDVSASSGVGQVARRSTSGVFTDVDRDGLPDVYVTNYGQAAEYWRNLGDGKFSEGAVGVGIADGRDATCQAWEDFDGDGLLDLFAAHEAGARDGLWLAKGGGTFADASGSPGFAATERGRGWGCAALDYDDDGDMDLLVAHSELQGSMRQQALLLRNKLDEHQGLGFEDATEEAGDFDLGQFRDYTETLATPRAASGALAVDWSVDGAVDLWTTSNDGDTARVFSNLGYTAWGFDADAVKVLLRGSASNGHGVGALVTVQAGSIASTRQLGAAMSWGSWSLTDLNHGISSGEEGGYNEGGTPAGVTIRWPSGAVQSTGPRFQGCTMVTFYEDGGWKNDSLAPRPRLALLDGQQGLHGWYTSASVTLKLFASEPSVIGSKVPSTGVASLRYSRDGSNWSTVANPTQGVALTFEGDGTHKLWVEVADKATRDFGNGVVVSDPNKAVLLYPIRIDSEPPRSQLASPAVGTVWAQGREVARVEQLNATNRAVVLASLPTDFGAVPEAGGALQGALGGDGLQPVEALPRDDTSGVWKVRYEVLRTDGRVEASSPELRWAPYAWTWRVNATPPLEYRILTHVADYAGHCRGKVSPNGPDCPGGPAFMSKVELVPTSPDGLRRLNDISTPAPP